MKRFRPRVNQSLPSLSFSTSSSRLLRKLEFGNKSSFSFLHSLSISFHCSSPSLISPHFIRFNSFSFHLFSVFYFSFVTIRGEWWWSDKLDLIPCVCLLKSIYLLVCFFLAVVVVWEPALHVVGTSRRYVIGSRWRVRWEARVPSWGSFLLKFWFLVMGTWFECESLRLYHWQVSRLLDLIVHSLYSHKNWLNVYFVYVYSNASDALISWGSWVWQSLLCLEMVVTKQELIDCLSWNHCSEVSFCIHDCCLL